MPRPRWVKPSTRAFIKEARRISDYSVFDWLHGYVYARWPYLYIGMATAEHERGHVHNAFFKDAILGRFYAICNCCSCCCGAMQAHQNGVPMLASSGYVCQVDEECCVGCGACAGCCPFAAIHLDDKCAVVDATLCMGCGACVSKCTQDALSLERDERRGLPLEIERLMDQAAGATSTTVR